MDIGEDSEIPALLIRIERWFMAHGPAGTAPQSPFLPASSEAAVADLDRHIHQFLPDQIRIFLLTRDGGRRGIYPLPMRSTNPAIWRILPTREIASEWDRLCSVSIAVPFRYEVKTSGPVKATWWNPAWVPIAECGTGDVVCIDLDPSGGGAIGQIILYQHDYEERKVLHTCLLDWLRECADDLDHGKYVYADGIGIVERSAGSPNPH